MSKPPDLKRHRLIAKLRAKEMSYQAIADQLGVSHQAVHEIMQRDGNTRNVLIHCRQCQSVITKMRMNTNQV